MSVEIPENIRPAYRAGYEHGELAHKSRSEGLTEREQERKTELYYKMLDADSTYQDLFHRGNSAGYEDAADRAEQERAGNLLQMEYAEVDNELNKIPNTPSAGGSRELA